MINRRSLLLRAGVLALGGGAAWLLREKVFWPAPSVAFAEQWSSGWLPLVEPRSILTVAAEAAGVKIRALIDTGAERSVVDRAFADRLGLARRPGAMLAIGVDGSPKLGRGASLAVRIGEMSMDSLQAAVLDLSALEAVGGFGVPLVIGQDVLGQLTLDLDLPRRRLAFRAAVDPETSAPGAVEVLPARKSGRALYVPVTVEGHELEALLDTGSSSILALSADAARSAGLLRRGRPVRATPSITLGGASADQVVVASSISVAGRSFAQAPVQIYESVANVVLPPGLLGARALGDSRMLIDLGQGRLMRFGAA